MALLPLLLLPMALAPLALGVLLAAATGFHVPGPVLAGETLAVTALTLAGLASREAYAPGIGRWPHLLGPDREGWLRLAYLCLILAGVLVLFLQGMGHTGALTTPLAALGVLGGFFVFAPPLAWHRRGLGEIWGGLSFGLLPVFTGFYLTSPHPVGAILLYGVPLSLAAFNLFLLLGFPEPAGAGTAAAPFSLAARLGPLAAALTYTIVNILVILCLVANLFFPAGGFLGRPWLWALVILALVIQEMIKRRAYYQAARLPLLCGLTLALHLGMSLVFALGLWGRL